MSVVVVGIEHRQAPLDLLERVTVGDEGMAKFLGSLRDRVNLQESVLLSTCLRTEVYAVVDRFHEAVSEVEELLAATSGIEIAELEAHRSIRFDDDVAPHLFRVASGLESAVLGESEVLGQVRRAWERAQDERVSGPVLGGLFRHALETGKRVRSETAIARGTTSFAHAAVELAEQRRVGGLRGTSVVVVGAGAMGAGLVGALAGLSELRRPRAITVVNRSVSRGRAAIASAESSIEMEVHPLGSLSADLADADVVVVAVGASEHIMARDQLEGAIEHRNAPLLIVDVGLPRNVDPRAAGLSGVTLLDMDDLRGSVDRALEERQEEAGQAQSIVEEELARYRAATRARAAAPLVAALRDRLEEIRRLEVERRRGRSGELSDEELAQIDGITRSVLAKLLHEPTVVLKETTGTPRGERLVEALRTLFDL